MRAVVLVLLAVAIGGFVVFNYFVTSDADEVHAFLGAPQQAARPGGCSATAWSVRGLKKFALWVGAVDGDGAPCDARLPVACFKPGSAEKPADFTLPPQARWSGGELTLTQVQVQGVDVADELCVAQFGADWRAARLDDGGAWGLGANGELPASGRFWVRAR